MHCILIPAAGKGMRFGDEQPKQYTKIHGVPLISYTVEAATKLDFIDLIVVIADNVQKMENILEPFMSINQVIIKVIKGDSTRHRSIQKGIEYLVNENITPDIVLIHDGVRPLIPTEIAKEVVDKACKYGAAGPVCGLVSTVVKPDKKFLELVLPRNNYMNSEMPQGFRYTILKESYQLASQEELDNGTEVLDLVSRHTHTKVRLITGTQNLWKLTYPQDIIKATATLKCTFEVGLLNILVSPLVLADYHRCKLIALENKIPRSLQYIVISKSDCMIDEEKLKLIVYIQTITDQLNIKLLQNTRKSNVFYVITEAVDMKIIDYCINIIQSPSNYPWISIL